MTTKEIKIQESEEHIQKLADKAAEKGNKPQMLAHVESYRRALEVLKNSDESYFDGDNAHVPAATLLYVVGDFEE